MGGTENLVIVEVEVNSFTNLVITNRTNEAFEMELAVQSFKDLSFNFLATSRTIFSKELVEVLLTVWFVVVFVELVPFERLSALGADKMVRVPRLTQSRNILSFDDFVAISASRVEFCVVVVLTVIFPIFFDERLSS